MIIRIAFTIVLVCAMLLSARAAEDLFGDPLPKNAVQRLGTTRLRNASVSDIRYLPDGRGLVASGRRVEIWDLAAGRIQTNLVASRNGIISVMPRKDGKALLVADSGGNVREWSLNPQRELRSWPTGQRGLRLAYYSPDETRVLTCGATPPTLKEWNLADGKELVSIRGKLHSFYEAVYGADGRTAIAGGPAGSGTVLAHYDLQTGTLLHEWLKDYNIYERCLAVSPDGARLLSGSRSRATETQLDDYKLLASFTGHNGGAVVSLAYCKEPDQLLTGSRDGSIRRWDRLKKQVLARWWAHPAYVTRLQVSPDGKWALSYGGGVIAECSIADGSPRLKWERHTQPVQCVAALPDNRVVSGSADGTLRVWDIVSGRSLTTIRNTNLVAWTLATSPDGTRIAAGCKDGVIREFAANDGRLLRELQGHTGYVRSVQYFKDGLVSSADDGSIRFWNSTGVELQRVIEGDLAARDGHRGGVLSVAVSPDGDALLSGGRDGTMRLWRVRDGKQVAVFDQHRGWVEAVAFAGDNHRAVSASRDGVLRLWNLETKKLLAEINVGGAVTAMACSVDGSRAHVSLSGNVACWDLVNAKQIAALKGHNGAVTSLTLAKDGKRLVSASQDTTLLVWQVPP